MVAQWSQDEISSKMIEILLLKHTPVAVKLIPQGEDVPSGLQEPPSRLTYCEAVMNASGGKSYFLQMKNFACADGASALGLMKLPESIANGQVYYALGSFASQETAKYVANRKPRLETGKFSGVAVAPLNRSNFTPDVVLIHGTPEQAMWISSAFSYDTGEKVDFQAAGPFNAACIEATVIPYLDQKVNISLGCAGCRSRTEIGDNEMYVGIPGSALTRITTGLEALSGLIKQTRDRPYIEVGKNSPVPGTIK